MNTPKYVGILYTSDSTIYVVSSGDNKNEVDHKINEHTYGIDDRLGDLYVRERDTRAQFSPAELEELCTRINKATNGFLLPQPSEAEAMAKAVLDYWRELNLK